MRRGAESLPEPGRVCATSAPDLASSWVLLGLDDGAGCRRRSRPVGRRLHEQRPAHGSSGMPRNDLVGNQAVQGPDSPSGHRQRKDIHSVLVNGPEKKPVRKLSENGGHKFQSVRQRQHYFP